MKVKAIVDYNDLKLKRLVKQNEEFEVTEERGKDLITAKVAIKVDTPETKAGNDAEPTTSSSSSPKKRGKKKES